MLIYPVTLTPDDNGTLLVGFPDIPEANSVGDDEQEALLNAEEALVAALEIYFDEKRQIPMPSKVKKAQPAVTLQALVTAKVLLMNEMLGQKVRKAELARRLDVHMPQVDRLFDLQHSTKLEFIESAYHKLGKQISISIV
ncbi:MAG: type II toxin-antitoxin system HicB family antitoxin [Advenella sp.]|uniref:HicB family protein n=1 Tax=Advenella kashmirensis TaxID=310575 RepID=A0A356LH12_9BURK|nr:type II toxin-antitoxin system HicB family antitoxin [Advenella sp. FME57]HBP30058.1 HicB family protein [Advenella kashmirensis]